MINIGGLKNMNETIKEHSWIPYFLFALLLLL